MITTHSLSEVLDSIYSDIKSTISNKYVKFSRIEKDNDQWLLSIILISDLTDQSINEIVIETNIDNNENHFIIKTDLSYGNGTIINERIINVYNNHDKSELKEFIKRNLYNAEDIESAINKLIIEE